MEVPLLLAVLGLFVAVRTLFLVRRRRTALRRPSVPLLPRPRPRPRPLPSAPDRALVDLRAADRPSRPAAQRRAA